MESLRASGPECRLAGGVVERVVRRGLQRRLVEAAHGQDPAYAVELEGLAGVRGADQRAQVVGQVQAELHHRERLQRLVARPGQDRRVDRPDRPVDRPVGGQGHQRAVVVPLDEAGADDLGDGHGDGHGAHPRRGVPGQWRVR